MAEFQIPGGGVLTHERGEAKPTEEELREERSRRFVAILNAHRAKGGTLVRDDDQTVAGDVNAPGWEGQAEQAVMVSHQSRLAKLLRDNAED